MQRLTNAPLPRLGHIFKALTDTSSINDSDLGATWLGENDLGFWLSRSAWSLFLIAKYRFSVSDKDQLNVWLPSYFCNASLAPLRELNINLIFYPLLDAGSPNIDVCNEILTHESSPDLFIAVHYFGYSIELEQTANFVKSQGAWLIEDAAQILSPQKKIGDHSHFLLYSPHKFLPIPDGALLIIKSNNLFLDYSLQVLNFDNLYKNTLAQPQQKILATQYWLVKRCLQKLGFRKVFNSASDFDHDEVVMNTLDFIHPKMSMLAKKLLRILLGTLENELNIRHKNYQSWCKALINSNFHGEEFFPKYKNVSPYLFGIKFSDHQTAKKVFSHFINKKIPVSTWPDLPPEVLSDPDRHRKTIDLRRNSVFLPIHRSINVDKIKSYLT